MYATIDADLLQQAERAERQRRAREYVRIIRKITPAIVDATAMIRDRWSELPPKIQASHISNRDAIVASTKNIAERPPANFLKGVSRFVYGVQLVIDEPAILRFAVAIAMFTAAVDAAVARDRTALRRAELELEAHPELAVVADGEPVDFDAAGILRRLTA